MTYQARTDKECFTKCNELEGTSTAASGLNHLLSFTPGEKKDRNVRPASHELNPRQVVATSSIATPLGLL